MPVVYLRDAELRPHDQLPMASPRWRRTSPEREDRQRPQQPLNRNLLTTRLTMTRRNPAWRVPGELQPHDYEPAEAESARTQGSNPLRREAQATRRIFAPGVLICTLR